MTGHCYATSSLPLKRFPSVTDAPSQGRRITWITSYPPIPSHRLSHLQVLLLNNLDSTGLNWTQQLDSTAGLNSWTQQLDSTAGLDSWIQQLDSAAGIDIWTQQLDSAAGIDSWTQQQGSTVNRTPSQSKCSSQCSKMNVRLLLTAAADVYCGGDHHHHRRRLLQVLLVPGQR